MNDTTNSILGTLLSKFFFIKKGMHKVNLTYVLFVFSLLTYGSAIQADSTKLCQNIDPIEICIAIDGSGSISSADFAYQIKALSDVVIDPTAVCQTGKLALSIVQFSSSSRTEITSTTIANQSDAVALQTKVEAITKKGGGTSIGSGIDQCLDELTFNSNKQVILVATDGRSSSGVKEAEAAIAKGVDAINTMGVGDSFNKTQLTNIAYPKPVSNEAVEDGFFVETPNYQSFSEEIRKMIAGGNYLPPPEKPNNNERSLHENDKLHISAPPSNVNEDQYVYMELPSGDIKTMRSKNTFNSFNGQQLEQWAGGSEILDVNISSALPDGTYLLNLLTVPKGQEPLKRQLSVHGTVKTISLHKKKQVNPDGFVQFEFGCKNQAALASAKMPITVNENYSLFNGKVYFTDYNGEKGFGSLSGSFDSNKVISGNIQFHFRENDFQDFTFYRTDTFQDTFDPLGQLMTLPSVTFQPDESGCDIFVKFSILNASTGKRRGAERSKLFELFVK